MYASQLSKERCPDGLAGDSPELEWDSCGILPSECLRWTVLFWYVHATAPALSVVMSDMSLRLGVLLYLREK